MFKRFSPSLSSSLTFLLFLLLSSFSGSHYKLIASLPAGRASFTTDNLGNVYLLKKNVLEKYDREGRFLNTFSDKELGEISFVDASNPMKLMLFSKAFASIRLLDNTLSPNSEPLHLHQSGFPFAGLAAASHDNGFWIYDAQNSELLRTGKDLVTTHRSGNISQALGYKPEPDYLLEYNNLVYLNNPSTGILVFDVFGAYYKTLPLMNLHAFQLDGSSIRYFSGKKIISYHTKLLSESETLLPDSGAAAARTENERLYLLKNDTLRIYSVK